MAYYTPNDIWIRAVESYNKSGDFSELAGIYADQSAAKAENVSFDAAQAARMTRMKRQSDT